MNNKDNGSKVVKYILITVSLLFVFLFLILPLVTVITEALKKGWDTYIQAVTDEYTVKAILLTVELLPLQFFSIQFSDFSQHGQ